MSLFTWSLLWIWPVLTHVHRQNDLAQVRRTARAWDHSLAGFQTRLYQVWVPSLYTACFEPARAPSRCHAPSINNLKLTLCKIALHHFTSDPEVTQGQDAVWTLPGCVSWSPLPTAVLGIILFSSMDTPLEPQLLPFINASVAFRKICYKFFVSAAPKIKLFTKKSGNKVTRYLVWSVLTLKENFRRFSLDLTYSIDCTTPWENCNKLTLENVLRTSELRRKIHVCAHIHTHKYVYTYTHTVYYFTIEYSI